MKQNLLNIIDKPMDRKEFLKHLGIGSLFLMGGGMIWQSLTESTQKSNKSLGYGASAYGGKRR